MHTALRYRTNPLVLKLALHHLRILRQRQRDHAEDMARENRKGWFMPYCVHGNYTGDPLWGYGAFKNCEACESGLTIHEEALGLARNMIREGRDAVGSELLGAFFGNRALLTPAEQEAMFTLACRLVHANVTF